ncbi:MAG: signal peptidase I [Chloroflexi bacterium]|nr:signal peptidase I [Chloroflexota bacterium]
MTGRPLSTLRALLRSRRVVVHEWSMAPTLLPGELLLIDTLAYGLGQPQSGDIVLARHPTAPAMLLVKRLAGLPGQEVRLDSHGCWVDGHPFALAAGEATDLGEGLWQLAKGHYFLLGDAPEWSQDSRHFGPVERDALLGRAWLVCWPPAHVRRLSSGASEGG